MYHNRDYHRKKNLGEGGIEFTIRISRNLMISRRIRKLRVNLDVDTQKMCAGMLESLEEIFELASSLARAKVETQTEEGETVKVTLRQRQAWARVAAYVAQTMNSIAEGFDERKIDAQLDKLERLVNEARAKAKVRKPRKRASQARIDRPSEGQD